jgi:hypothetical protein
MRARCLLPWLVVVAGCNQLFGLDAPVDDHDGGGDAATTDGRPDDRDGGDAIDAGDIGIDASMGIPGVIWAVDLDYVSSSGAVRGYEASASFGSTESCARVAVSGTCYAEHCTSVLPELPAPDSKKITIEGFSLVQLAADSNGIYAPVSGTGSAFFDDAVTCGLYSEGGSVPAFNGTLASTYLVTLSSPSIPSPSTPALVVRSAGLAMQWQPTNGTVYVLIGDSSGGRVQCDFSASDGSASVPGTVLGELASGIGSFSAYNVARLQIPAGEFDIQWNLARAARRNDGNLARGTLTLQ